MFSRRMMSLSLPVLVLSLVGFMPGTAKAWDNQHPSPKQCCCSLITVNIVVVGPIVDINDIDILNYNTVNVASFWNNVDILTFENFLNHDPVASFNEIELNGWFREFNVLSENQTVVGLINGVVYYLDNH